MHHAPAALVACCTCHAQSSWMTQRASQLLQRTKASATDSTSMRCVTRTLDLAAMRTRLVPLAAVQQLLEQGAADVDLCTNHCGSDAHRGAPGPYTTHLCSGAPQAPQEMAALVLQDHDAGTGLADTLQNAHQVLHVADVKYRQLQPYVACVTSGAAACVRLASLGDSLVQDSP